MDLWKEFLSKHEFGCDLVCQLVKIMISIPPNTGWIKRAYSYFELICAKRRNRMSISTMANLLFVSVLKRPVRDSPDYQKEIKRMHCGH